MEKEIGIITEKREKQILMMSFVSGLIFAVIEFIFAIYSHSQSSLTDAVCDASELVFIALLLFITPLFHKPISEKHPYGYFQVESIFVIIKSVMMLSVSLGVSAEVIETALSGGNPVNNAQVSFFQLTLGVACLIIFLVMNRLNKNLSSPTIQAELLGWKLDVVYSLGMALAFVFANYLKKTSLAFIVPYFDQIMAVIVMIFMLPESVKILWSAIRDLFLFSPEESFVQEIKTLCQPILERWRFIPVFYDVTKTGRHLWVAIYFKIEAEQMVVDDFKQALEAVNAEMKAVYEECTCELILVPSEAKEKQPSERDSQKAATSMSVK